MVIMRIYLAGPDVFLPHADAMAAEKRRLCALHGHDGVFPTDPSPGPDADAADKSWQAIYRRNESLIRACDALIANLTPFRGVSADAGTVYELGFARALGLKVLGYSNAAADFITRTRQLGGATAQRADGRWTDAEGLAIEDHGLADNLMIEGGIRAAGGVLVRRDVPAASRWTDVAGFEDCLRALRPA